MERTIELTEREVYHLGLLLEGGIKMTDSIFQTKVFEGILSKLGGNEAKREAKKFVRELNKIEYKYD